MRLKQFMPLITRRAARMGFAANPQIVVIDPAGNEFEVSDIEVQGTRLAFRLRFGEDRAQSD